MKALREILGRVLVWLIQAIIGPPQELPGRGLGGNPSVGERVQPRGDERYAL